ncbi:UNVERIFIED_CONTAM: hypothetical protein Sradi_3196900 [Sesamum radiatum]|uniref:Reverse transcriptase domain-containing protein n=1 Tax=Sesamum radiatum TaxID=300843 RepID=A0AAW2RFW4_SESRA
MVLPSLDISDHEDSNAIMIATNNEEDWRTPLIEYLKYGKLPDDTRHKIESNTVASHCDTRRTHCEDNALLRLEELEALDEKRLEAQQQLQCYQARMTRAFNKKVRPRSFQVGDLVFSSKTTNHPHSANGNKFVSKWDGPYVVKEAYTNGAYKLVDKDGLRIGPINGKFLKRYYL